MYTSLSTVEKKCPGTFFCTPVTLFQITDYTVAILHPRQKQAALSVGVDVYSCSPDPI